MSRSRKLLAALACPLACLLAWPVIAVTPQASAQEAPRGVPTGFVASSASWTSASDGWLLGFHPCAGKGSSCPALVHTTDEGATWHRESAPRVRISPRFRQVRFVFAPSTQRQGAIGLASDGKRLFVTNDAAASWQRAALASGARIGDLGVAGGSAYAIIGTGTTDDGSTALYTTSRGGNDWAPVPGVRVSGNGVNVDGGYDLATQGPAGTGSAAAVALGRIFVNTGYWTTTKGGRWHRHPAPCTKEQVPSFNWVDRHRVVATCSYDPGMSRQFKDVRVSIDGGAFTTTTSAPIDLFTTATGAARPGRPFIGATAAGVAWLYGTFDDGQTWKTVLKVDDELPYYDLQFPDPQHGFVVSGGSAYGRGAVYTTSDGGQTWQPLL